MGGVLILVGGRLRFKALADRQIIRPFECGFDPKSKPRLPLSIRFYLIAIIFLIFDVELVLIFPVVFSTGQDVFVSIRALLVFVLVLLLGLYYELSQGRLR